MQPILTERLKLRPPCNQDAAPLLAIRNSPFVLRYNAMRPLTLPQMEQQLEQLHDSMLVLSCKDSGFVIGAAFFSPDRMRYQTGSLCLSYYLGESWCRQGYMSEALAALIPQLFAQGAQLLCQAGLPTGRLPAARRTGVWRDHLRRLPVFNPEGRILI